MLSGRVHIVTSPHLVAVVGRSAKTLPFNPFIAQLGARLTGADPATRAIINTNTNGEDGHWGYVIEIHDRTVIALRPGPALLSMTLNMLEDLGVYLDAIAESDEGKIVGLEEWLREVLTVCSSSSIYGSENPVATDSSMTKAYWDYDSQLNTLLIDVLPNVIAPKGFKGRAKFGEAFARYFSRFEEILESAKAANEREIRDGVELRKRTRPPSALAVGRHAVASKYGMSHAGMGKLEVGTLIGILANTVPTIFWLLLRIYSDPELLSSIRAELERCVDVTTLSPSNPNNPPNQQHGQSNPLYKCTLRIDLIRARCPLFTSTYQETMRIHSLGVTARYVLEDTLLDGRWLLHKDSVVQIPGAVIHRDPGSWGAESNVFDPWRFVPGGKPASAASVTTTTTGAEVLNDQAANGHAGAKAHNSTTGSPNAAGKTVSSTATSRPAASYRPYGGGSTICPGRHFAAAEIFGMVGMMVLRFDIEPVDDKADGTAKRKKEWVLPKPEQKSLVTAVFGPDRDVRVRLRRREGMDGKREGKDVWGAVVER
ncbi:hypothetical protein MMC25_003734 [Agyrium rufum]|nr:hypothetical protein [Agyrium rufum]